MIGDRWIYPIRSIIPSFEVTSDCNGEHAFAAFLNSSDQAAGNSLSIEEDKPRNGPFCIHTRPRRRQRNVPPTRKIEPVPYLRQLSLRSRGGGSRPGFTAPASL